MIKYPEELKVETQTRILEKEYPGVFVPDNVVTPAKSCLPEIKIKRIRKDELLPPGVSIATPGSSGLDLYSCITTDLFFGEMTKIPTNIAVQMPVGYEGQIRPRSGLSLRGVHCAFGTIDNDYRGELYPILTLQVRGIYTVKRGDRIAQLVIQKIPQFRLKFVDELDPTDRGCGGFGSTGR